MPTVSSVHTPNAMNDLSIKPKRPTKQDVYDYAEKYKINFVQAFRELCSSKTREVI